jgi:predicted PolB exonuclease-like 3'-5' exonuclease
MGLPGKPDGMSGGEVENYYREGRIREIAEYCESDVVNTYRVCCAMSCSAGDCLMLHSRLAKQAWSNLSKRAVTRSHILLI